MLKMLGWARTTALLALALGSPSAAWAYAGVKWNLPEGVTEISHEVHSLHMMSFIICCVIGLIVFGAMFYSIFAHRRSKHPKPADFHESTTIEIIWTAIPFVILIGMAIPAARTLIKMDDSANSEITVKITGYQWKWQYEYLGEDVSFFSTLSAESNKAREVGSGIDVTKVENYLVDVDNPLVLPVGKKIRFLITSNDVIHAWWVSAIAVKKDAIPGYINEVWTKIDEPGTYRGVCAELCGRDHGFMPIVVKALPEAEYAVWLAEHKPAAAAPAAAAAPVAPPPMPSVATAAPAAEAPAAAAPAAPAAPAEAPKAAAVDGSAVYMKNCAACHQPGGTGIPPTFPSLIGSKVVNGPAEPQIVQVIKGKNVMPPFGTSLSDDEIAAVVNYTRTSWGNKGAAVTPAQVTAARGK